MDSNSGKPAFVEVPFHCPLPASCPVCGSPVEKSLKTHAWEGIPFFFTYHVSVGIPYCRRHYDELSALQWRQRLAIWGIFLSPLAGAAFAGIAWSLWWLFYVGCLFSVAFTVYAFRYSRKLRRSRGIWMRTMGSWPGYRLIGFRPQWNAALMGLVDQFNRTQQTGSKGLNVESKSHFSI